MRLGSGLAAAGVRHQPWALGPRLYAWRTRVPGGGTGERTVPDPPRFPRADRDAPRLNEERRPGRNPANLPAVGPRLLPESTGPGGAMGPLAAASTSDLVPSVAPAPGLSFLLLSVLSPVFSLRSALSPAASGRVDGVRGGDARVSGKGRRTLVLGPPGSRTRLGTRTEGDRRILRRILRRPGRAPRLLASRPRYHPTPTSLLR